MNYYRLTVIEEKQQERKHQGKNKQARVQCMLGYLPSKSTSIRIYFLVCPTETSSES